MLRLAGHNLSTKGNLLIGHNIVGIASGVGPVLIINNVAASLVEIDCSQNATIYYCVEDTGNTLSSNIIENGTTHITKGNFAVAAGTSDNTISLLAVPEGIHWLHLVAKNAGGFYSNVEKVQFQRQGSVVTISTLLPINGATGVATNVSPVITFSADVAPNIGKFVIERDNAGSWVLVEEILFPSEIGTGDGQGSDGGNFITLNLTGALLTSTIYAITMTGAALIDASNNPIDAITARNVWSFTTGAAQNIQTIAQFVITGNGSSTISQVIAPLDGDTVCVDIITGSNAARTCAVSTAGYTAIGTKIDANGTSQDCSLHSWWKRMGSTPDTSVVISAPGSSNTVHIAIITIYRFVDSVVPIDAGPTATSGVNSVLANPGAITPVTNNALIHAVGAGARANTATDTYLSSDLADFITGQHTVSVYNGIYGVGHKLWNTGDPAFDAAAFTNATTAAGTSWAAKVYALRPQP